MKNIDELDLVTENTPGVKYLRLDKFSTNISAPSEELTESQSLENEQISPSNVKQNMPENEISKQIFVAHGKNKLPLEQLEKILRKFKVNYKVAIDEPHEGRPISAKVASLMKNSTSGIFIFTADEKTTDENGSEVWRA